MNFCVATVLIDFEIKFGFFDIFYKESKLCFLLNFNEIFRSSFRESIWQQSKLFGKYFFKVDALLYSR
jgi:hypothetical protein